MNANVKFVADLAIATVPLIIAIITAAWRFSIKLRENTTAVKRLADSIDGSVVSVGLNQRVRELEDYRTRQEAKAEVMATIKENEQGH